MAYENFKPTVWAKKIQRELEKLCVMQEQWNVDRAYNYQVGRDAIGDARYDKEWDKCALRLVENLNGWTGEKERQYG